VAFIKDNGNPGVEGEAQAVLSFEHGTILGTLDYFDMHRTKVAGSALKINCTSTEIFCR
jgi:hypothetical protein